MAASGHLQPAGWGAHTRADHGTLGMGWAGGPGGHQHLLSLLLQLLGLHALLYLGQEGRTGGGGVLQAPLLGQLLHLHLQLPVGEPHLLQLQLTLVQLSGRQQRGVRGPSPTTNLQENTEWGRSKLEGVQGMQLVKYRFGKLYRTNSPASSTDKFQKEKDKRAIYRLKET